MISLSKRKKRKKKHVGRACGGSMFTKCVHDRVQPAFLTEEQKIVVKVLMAQAVRKLIKSEKAFFAVLFCCYSCGHLEDDRSGHLCPFLTRLPLPGFPYTRCQCTSCCEHLRGLQQAGNGERKKCHGTRRSSAKGHSMLLPSI
jgi:hypothetical protein